MRGTTSAVLLRIHRWGDSNPPLLFHVRLQDLVSVHIGRSRDAKMIVDLGIQGTMVVLVSGSRGMGGEGINKAHIHARYAEHSACSMCHINGSIKVQTPIQLS